MDNKKCKKRVYQGWHDYPCSRKAIKDGYCKQHHPDSVKARQEKSDKRYREEGYRRAKMYAFSFVEEATEEDLKKLLKTINKKLAVTVA